MFLCVWYACCVTSSCLQHIRWSGNHSRKCLMSGLNCFNCLIIIIILFIFESILEHVRRVSYWLTFAGRALHAFCELLECGETAKIVIMWGASLTLCIAPDVDDRCCKHTYFMTDSTLRWRGTESKYLGSTFCWDRVKDCFSVRPNRHVLTRRCQPESPVDEIPCPHFDNGAPQNGESLCN